VPMPRHIQAGDLDALAPDALIKQCLEWAEAAYWDLNRQLGEELYRTLRQNEVTLKTIFEADDPFYRRARERLEASVDREAFAPWYEQPVRRLPDELESKVREAVVETQRLFRDRRLMLRQIDDHWIRHLTSLDVLREGIGLRAIGQQNPLVAYQKEAYEMYQEMLASIQSEIVRSLFLVPQAAQRRAPQRDLARSFRLTAPQRQLSFHGAGAGDSRERQPQRATRRLGRNDPCWCGSGVDHRGRRP